MGVDRFDRTMLHGNVETLVLSMLAKEDTWAYRLRKELKETSKGAFQISLSRLYPLLESLEERALVKSRMVTVGNARTRRLYEITARGRKECKIRKSHWRLFVKSMTLVLGKT